MKAGAINFQNDHYWINGNSFSVRENHQNQFSVSVIEVGYFPDKFNLLYHSSLTNSRYFDFLKYYFEVF